MNDYLVNFELFCVCPSCVTMGTPHRALCIHTPSAVTSHVRPVAQPARQGMRAEEGFVMSAPRACTRMACKVGCSTVSTNLVS